MSTFADEIIVGVDEASTDRTYELAAESADVVFRFEHIGTIVPARMLALEYASCDWVLVLDDDEKMDGNFHSLLPDLLQNPLFTHYWFPCKWVIQLKPLQYLRANPWFPDWHVRLFRNDKNLVWCTGRVHTGYQVLGRGYYESRTSILHYGLINKSKEAIEDKLARYRSVGSEGRCEDYYFPSANVNRALVEAPPQEVFMSAGSLRKPPLIVSNVHRSSRSSTFPPWRARLCVQMPTTYLPNERVLASVDAVNEGGLSWISVPNRWPHIRVSYHIRDVSGKVITWDGERTPIYSTVEPNRSTSILASFTAPKDPGEYLVEWDMVSESECWFAECGSPTEIVRLQVVL